MNYSALRVSFSIAALDENLSTCMSGVDSEEAREVNAQTGAGYIAFRMIGKVLLSHLGGLLLS